MKRGFLRTTGRKPRDCRSDKRPDETTRRRFIAITQAKVRAKVGPVSLYERHLRMLF
jgi:hypothetical protein